LKRVSGKSQRETWKYLREQEVELDVLPRGGHPLWAMLYPARYEVGMANLGYQTIISEMRTLGVGIERFFFGSAFQPIGGGGKIDLRLSSYFRVNRL